MSMMTVITSHKKYSSRGPLVLSAALCKKSNSFFLPGFLSYVFSLSLFFFLKKKGETTDVPE
jgi:hypothetical protein